MVWQFVQDNIKLFEARWAGDNSLAEFVKNLASSFASLEVADEMMEYWTKRSATFPGLTMSLKQGIENINIMNKWLSRDGESIRKYLEEFEDNMM